MTRPRTPPADVARRLLAADFLDPALIGPAGGAAGHVLGDRFELLGQLGRGGAGVVWRARDRQTGREVALKLLARTQGSAAERMLREGALAASLEHPGVVACHESGQLEGQPYLLYELIEGGRTLADALPTLDWSARLTCVRQVAAAVAHAHGRGVVHRDLKPANVLLDRDGRARVTDFGVGWAADLQTLTASGAAVGTPAYMAPEQITGGGGRAPAVDVWALGVLLYRCAADRLPFTSPSLLETAHAIVAGRCVPVRQAAPHVPPAVAAVCARCLRVDPAERYPDAAAVAAALDRATTPAPAGRGGAWTGALAGALVTAGIAWAAWPTPSPAPGRPSPASSPAADPTLATPTSEPPAWKPPPTPSPSAGVVPATPPSGPTASPSAAAPRVRIDGYLEAIDDRGWVIGWAADPARQDAPVEVELVVTRADGAVVHRERTTTHQARADVQRHRGYGGQTYGFHRALPETLRDGQAYTLSVVAGFPPRPLARSPQPLQLPRPIGASPHELLTPSDPPTQLETGPAAETLDALFAAQPLGQLAALRLRLDLRLEFPPGGPAGQLVARLVAESPRGEPVAVTHPLWRRERGPDGATVERPPDLVARRWRRLEHDLLPSLRAAARAGGLDPVQTAALIPRRLHVGWVDAAGLQARASVADLSLVARPR